MATKSMNTMYGTGVYGTDWPSSNIRSADFSSSVNDATQQSIETVDELINGVIGNSNSSGSGSGSNVTGFSENTIYAGDKLIGADLPDVVASGIGTGVNVLGVMSGIDPRISGILGNTAGKIAGQGITVEDEFNIIANAALSALGVPVLALTVANKLGLNLGGGILSALGYTGGAAPGFEAGFFSKAALGNGINIDDITGNILVGDFDTTSNYSSNAGNSGSGLSISVGTGGGNIYGFGSSSSSGPYGTQFDTTTPVGFDSDTLGTGITVPAGGGINLNNNYSWSSSNSSGSGSTSLGSGGLGFQTGDNSGFDTSAW